MQHYKTFHLGCTKSDEVATTENNFDRINKRFNAAHRPIMGVLCRHFFYAQLLQQEGLLDKPYKLALIFFKGILENIYEDILEKIKIGIGLSESEKQFIEHYDYLVENDLKDLSHLSKNQVFEKVCYYLDKN